MRYSERTPSIVYVVKLAPTMGYFDNLDYNEPLSMVRWLRSISQPANIIQWRRKKAKTLWFAGSKIALHPVSKLSQLRPTDRLIVWGVMPNDVIAHRWQAEHVEQMHAVLQTINLVAKQTPTYYALTDLRWPSLTLRLGSRQTRLAAEHMTLLSQAEGLGPTSLVSQFKHAEHLPSYVLPAFMLTNLPDLVYQRANRLVYANRGLLTAGQERLQFVQQCYAAQLADGLCLFSDKWDNPKKIAWQKLDQNLQWLDNSDIVWQKAMRQTELLQQLGSLGVYCIVAAHASYQTWRLLPNRLIEGLLAGMTPILQDIKLIPAALQGLADWQSFTIDCNGERQLPQAMPNFAAQKLAEQMVQAAKVQLTKLFDQS